MVLRAVKYVPLEVTYNVLRFGNTIFILKCLLLCHNKLTSSGALISAPWPISWETSSR